jgi:hypothetical protein
MQVFELMQNDFCMDRVLLPQCKRRFRKSWGNLNSVFMLPEFNFKSPFKSSPAFDRPII